MRRRTARQDASVRLRRPELKQPHRSSASWTTCATATPPSRTRRSCTPPRTTTTSCWPICPTSPTPFAAEVRRHYFAYMTSGFNAVTNQYMYAAIVTDLLERLKSEKLSANALKPGVLRGRQCPGPADRHIALLPGRRLGTTKSGKQEAAAQRLLRNADRAVRGRQPRQHPGATDRAGQLLQARSIRARKDIPLSCSSSRAACANGSPT